MNLLGVSARSGASLLIVAHETEKKRRSPKRKRLVTTLLVINSSTLRWVNENNVFDQDIPAAQYWLREFSWFFQSGS
jgi:hypothetical protein